MQGEPLCILNNAARNDVPRHLAVQSSGAQGLVYCVLQYLK